MAERARTEALRDAGVPHAELAAAHGLAFVVHRLAIEYHRPARLDDLLAVETAVSALSPARLSLRQTVRRDVTTLVTLSVDLACVAADGRPARIPARWRTALAARAQPSLLPSPRKPKPVPTLLPFPCRSRGGSPLAEFEAHAWRRGLNLASCPCPQPHPDLKPACDKPGARAAPGPAGEQDCGPCR